MARVAKAHFDSKGRPEKYPWALWTDGQRWLLVQGEDFDGTTDSFKVLVHRKARKMGLKAETSINRNDKKEIIIRFFDPES